MYPVGRLDLDSEGLILLTNDKQLTHILLDEKAHEREYFAQVEGIPGEEALAQLRNGVMIENKLTLPAKCKIIPAPVPDNRVPPIRFRASIPVTWISLTLVEGRNRQVRKMTAAAGHPTLRLIRYRIVTLTIEGLPSGEWRELREDEVKNFLNTVGIK